MSEGVIEPSRVYSPGTQQRFYQTYNTRYVTPPSSTGGGGGGGYTPPSGPGGPGFLYRQFQRAPGGPIRVQVPNGVPKFLGARSIILFTWITAMIMVSLDEWHTHHVLPRPARLWYTSITYGILALLSSFDMMVPLVNALAVGLTISVGYNYYTGQGGFGNYGAQEGGGTAPTSGLGPTGVGTNSGGSGPPRAA